MEELKVMVNEIIHFVKHSSSKTITVEAPPATTQQEAPKEKKKRTPKESSEPVVLKCPKCGNGDVIKGKDRLGLFPLPEIMRFSDSDWKWKGRN